MTLFHGIQEVARNPDNLTKLAEGKTKEIYSIRGHEKYVLVRSKDSLTAFNAARKNEIQGKGRIANLTTTHIFQYLQLLGMKTHFLCELSDTEMIVEKCDMVPIEWVARRVATGSFLKRNPGVKEGYRFSSPKIETFYKDDAQDDPQWSDEQMISSGMTKGGLRIGKEEVDLMRRMTIVVFKVLERGFQLLQCSLIDMKIEFGVNSEGALVLADVIDNDSWRVWPNGDKRLQLDKQFYRELQQVTQDSLKELLSNYEKVMNLTGSFIKNEKEQARCLIVMGSIADKGHAEKIGNELRHLGIQPILRVCSAHKTTSEALSLVSEFEDAHPTVVIAVAGRSNGLGPVLAGNSTLPVINCPPASDMLREDIWSSLRMPSGMGCTTVLGAEEAAWAAAKMLSNHDHLVYGKILCAQLNNAIGIYKSSVAIR
ncbi:hypothetical protein WR25_15221 [Diploscapter pachys]|uniref:PurE domain-containing protein n=1 Tax=Diploscapter pachys TaxID=2018661 RepID=A0A2A2LUJ3_9BILA|nr:hypothetical protein WR25_15221 [Diploscapter pachys]